jgi:hypothetical protein
MSANQTAAPGTFGVATANELDQHGAPFTITDPNALVWSASDPSISVAAVGDGTPTAKVAVASSALAGVYTVTYADPAAPNIPITAGTVTVVPTSPAPASGSVDLGSFA